MPRLADQIAQAAGGREDQFMEGAVTSLARSLARAECFEISRDVALAVKTVRDSRPSTIVSALPFSRPPFPYTWVEWVAPEINAALERSPNGSEIVQALRGKYNDYHPIPERIGALIEEIGIPGIACVTWAWSQKEHGINICPYSMAMSWTPEGMNNYQLLADNNPVAAMVHQAMNSLGHQLHEWPKLSRGQARDLAANISSWKPHKDNPTELNAILEMEKWDRLIGSLHCLKHYITVAKTATPEELKEISGNWLADLAGEPVFIRAFLILLNTKNGVVSTREDMSKLNRARKKAGKPALREFQVTRLNLAQHAARATGQGKLARELARQHYVRGHFKVRKTGVFWWSPFVRGNSQVALVRERYVVA